MIFLFIIIWFCLGSFGKVIIDNEDNIRHIISGRSECDHCHHKLWFVDLLPVLWRVINRWKCRCCSQNISIIYILLELICGLVFGAIYYLFWFESWCIYIFARSIIMIIYWDIKNQTINLPFLGTLAFVGLFIPTINWTFVLVSTIGMIIVYVLWYIVNKLKTWNWNEWMWVGDILLVFWLSLYYLYYQNYLTDYNFGYIYSISDFLWSQFISLIYIFLVRIVISSIYWLLIGIIYIYMIDHGDDESSTIPFWPALILWFLTLLIL